MLLGAVLTGATTSSPTAMPTQVFHYNDGFFTPQALASPALKAVLYTEVGAPKPQDVLNTIAARLQDPSEIFMPQTPVPSLVQVSFRFTSMPKFLRTNGMATGTLRFAVQCAYSEDLYAAAGPARWTVAMRIGMAELFKVQYDQITSVYIDKSSNIMADVGAVIYTPVPTPAAVPGRHAETESRRAQPQDAAILYVTICAEPHGCMHYVEEDDDVPGWLYVLVIPVFILLVFVFCVIWTHFTELSCGMCYRCCDCCYKDDCCSSKEEKIQAPELETEAQQQAALERADEAADEGEEMAQAAEGEGQLATSTNV